MKLLSVILLLIVAISGNAEDTNTTFKTFEPLTIDSSIKIIQPKDKSLYVGERCTFVIRAHSDQVDNVILYDDNKEIENFQVIEKKKIYCNTIKLHIGANKIAVEFYKDGDLVKSFDRDIYYLSELFEGSDEDEAEAYDRNYLHTEQNEKECSACHNMKSNVPLNDEALEDVSETTCYECHKGMMRVKNTHAPTANWLCLNCHNGKVSEYNMQDKGKAKYIAPDPIAKTCEYCHTKVEKWTMNKYTHGPVNDGRCVRCHNPHGSNNEFFLRKPIWNLCTTCHAEKATGKHIVSSFVFARNAGAHPTKGPRDPARPERTFACSSCHNPHGSPGIFLLRMKGGTQPFGVCRRCHDK